MRKYRFSQQKMLAQQRKVYLLIEEGENFHRKSKIRNFSLLKWCCLKANAVCVTRPALPCVPPVIRWGTAGRSTRSRTGRGTRSPARSHGGSRNLRRLEGKNPALKFFSNKNALFGTTSNNYLLRYMVASCDIEPGDVILREAPILAGPNVSTGSKPVCVECLVPVSSTTFLACPKCRYINSKLEINSRHLLVFY